jgi:hypothetical protein
LTYAESSVAIIAACAPLLTSQFRWTVSKIRSYIFRTSSSEIPLQQHAERRQPAAQDWNYSQVSASDRIASKSQASTNDGTRSKEDPGSGIHVQRDVELEYRSFT